MSWLRYQVQQPIEPWRHNPALVQLLGLSPLLGATTRLQSAATIAAVTLVVMLGSATAISLLRPRISEAWRFPVFLAVSTVITSVLIILLGLINRQWVGDVGIYLPLVACNYLVLMELERSAYRHSLSHSLQSAANAGIAFALALLAFSTLRWLLASALDRLPAGSLAASSGSPGELILLPGFGLILLGLVIAAYQFLLTAREVTNVPPARRIRVTGKVR